MIESTLGKLKVGDGHPVRIMGVINLTPDSFYSGSVKRTDEEVIDLALQMERDGADIIDLGARSTAPYKTQEISIEVERRLLERAVRLVRSKVNIEVSADTTRFDPARAAIAAGATIINDVYGLRERGGEEVARLISCKDCSLILTAHEIRPRSLRDPLRRISDALSESLRKAQFAGIPERKIAIDPGIGFFSDARLSNVEWNTTVISKLDKLRESFNLPICIGISRKRFIGKITGGKQPEERLFGSLGATAIAVFKGCNVIRTHDVFATLDVVRVAEAIRRAGNI